MHPHKQAQQRVEQAHDALMELVTKKLVAPEEAYLKSVDKNGMDMLFKRNNIDLAKAKKDSFLKFAPSGVAAAAELQSKGFAYLKVG